MPQLPLGRTQNALKGRIRSTDLDELASQPGGFQLGTQQLSVSRETNNSDAPLMFITALAGVGKTAVISALLYAAIQSYCRNAEEELNKVVLIILPSLELREDLVRDIVATLSSKKLSFGWAAHQQHRRSACGTTSCRKGFASARLIRGRPWT